MSDPKASIDQEFSRMVELHHMNLRVFLRSSGAKSEFVDDLAQEAFLLAYRNWENYDPNRDFGKWLRGIAYKLLVNERRKQARRKRIMADDICELLLNQSEQEWEGRFEEEKWSSRADVLPNCLNALPEKSRELLRRRYELGEKASLIGEILGKKSTAIRKSLSRIRTTLKDCIESKVELAESSS